MRTNSILASALSVSMESEELMSGEELNPVTEETTVAVDEILEEVRDQGDVVEEHEDAVEEMEGAAESLESLICSLESAIADGGMNPQAADIHGRAVANAVRRLPIDGQQFTVSVESFGGTGDKLQASMEALEQAKDLLKKIWEGIKNAVVGAWKAMANFVKTIGTSAAALKRAAAVLKARAAKMSGKPKNEKIDGKAVSSALNVKGSVETAGEVVAALDALVAGGSKVIMAANKASNELKSIVSYVATGNGSAEPDYVELNKDLPRDQLPGAQIKIGENGIPSLEKTKGDFSGAEITVADANGVRNIAGGIEKVAKMIESFSSRDFKKLESEMNKHIKDQDAAVKKLEAEKDVKKDIQKDLKAFRKVSNIVRAVGPQYMAHAAQGAKAAYAYASKSAAQYA